MHYLGGTKHAVCYRRLNTSERTYFKPTVFNVKDNGPLHKCELNGLNKLKETFHCQVRTDFSVCVNMVSTHLKQQYAALLKVNFEPSVLTCQEAAPWYVRLPTNSLKQVG